MKLRYKNQSVYLENMNEDHPLILKVNNERKTCFNTLPASDKENQISK